MHPSFNPTVHVCLSVCPFIHPSINLSIHPTIHQIHWPIHLSISIHPPSNIKCMNGCDVAAPCSILLSVRSKNINSWSIFPICERAAGLYVTEVFSAVTQTYRVDVNDRLVLLLLGIHPENILDKLVICLVEVRGGHDDGRTWEETHTQTSAGHPASVLSQTTFTLTFFTHTGVEEAGAETVTGRHTEACVIWVNRNISENLAGWNKTETRNPLYVHVRLVQSIQRPVNTKHTLIQLKRLISSALELFSNSFESNKQWVSVWPTSQIFIGFVCHYNYPINFNMVPAKGLFLLLWCNTFLCLIITSVNCWIVVLVISWFRFKPREDRLTFDLYTWQSKNHLFRKNTWWHINLFWCIELSDKTV